MLLHQLIIPTFLFPLAVVSQSATYIVGANQALTDQTRSVIDTVDQERVIEDQVPKDLASLVERINSTIPLFKGVKPATNQGDETNIADSYGSFTDAIKDLAQDLQDKAGVYKAALQGKAIYNALNDLEPVLFNYGSLVISLVSGNVYKNEIGESGTGSFPAVTDARNAYAPLIGKP